MSGQRDAIARALPRLLERHCARLSACRRCSGLHEAVLPVLSTAREPRVMLVGQAPGKTELSDQKPFAGRAGKTLFKWLAMAGVDEPTFRDRVYIAAVTRCYPGPSPSGRGDRVPSPVERERCSVWLEEELRIIRPEILIPVGKLAIERFLPAAPLDALVGRAHVVQHEGGTSLAIPLPHPSGASSWIHAPGHMALLERALEILGRELRRLGVASSVDASMRVDAPETASPVVGSPLVGSREARGVASSGVASRAETGRGTPPASQSAAERADDRHPAPARRTTPARREPGPGGPPPDRDDTAPPSSPRQGRRSRAARASSGRPAAARRTPADPPARSVA